MTGVGKRVAVGFLTLAGALGATALDGSWRGDLKVGMTTLPIVFNFSENGGVTTCTMDSPNQNAKGIPATVDYAAPDSVSVSVAAIGATFTGRVSADEIAGMFTQRGFRLPLTLKVEQPISQRRPQTPVPPFPYQQVDTIFRSADGTELSATITLPQGYRRGAAPMCVFVTGSGPQNRDEELFEHKPFAVIADFLARNGVASLRYDDRGTGASKGDFASATTYTFLDDAAAALQLAKDINGAPTGIIGHSEGGTIGLLLAAEGKPDFVVSLAGMAVSGKETILAQNRLSMTDMGLPAANVEASMKLLDAVFDEIIRQRSEGRKVEIDADAIAKALGVEVPAPLMQSIKRGLPGADGYFGALLSIDARVKMPAIACPVLALNGSLDTQVDPAANLAAVNAGIKNATVKELPGLNHLFQHAKTGRVKEYSEISETISPEVLDLILEFVRSL